MTIQANTTRARETCSVTDCRSKPGDYTRANRCDRHDALLKLAPMLRPGDTIYTILRHVSRSGMSRSISTIVFDGDGPFDITYLVARVLGCRIDQVRGGMVIGGAGMDMGFAVVHRLSQSLYPDGYPCTGRDGYGDDCCPSADHMNPPRPKPDGKMLHTDGYALRQRWL